MRSIRFATELCFNDARVQRYDPGGFLTPHRDGDWFLNLSAVLVLQGYGRFGFCEDRDFWRMRLMVSRPGTLLLIRGTGFIGAETQPFHFIDNVQEERLTLTFRQNGRPQ